jgi:YidC/Oxa1 family membrane protein insertase
MMTPPPTDEQQALNYKVMQYMMIFMGLVFYKVASGLCIYFIASSLWGVAERKLLPMSRVSCSGESGSTASSSRSRAQ